MGKWVRLACRRHLRDLVRSAASGLYFDPAAADRAVSFFGLLRHSKGRWAGQPIVLAPWQVFVVGSIAGWKRPDGTRRFRLAYIETGKKSGKSTLIAGLSLLFTFFDSPMEHGAEGYTAGTKREQAKITWDEAREMVRCSPGLRRHIKVWGGDGPKARGSMTCAERRQKLEPLGKDTEGLDGVNVHFAGVDELHKHRDRAIFDILRDSRRARSQPLIVVITNSGYDRATICGEQRDRAEQVLEESRPGDDVFAFICCIDKGDDWRDETKWCKANPGLGVTVNLEDLRQDCETAKASPGYVNTFRRYSCGEWVAVDERAIDMDRWNLCGAPVPLLSLRRRACYGGLDLATTVDLAAFALTFPPPEEDLEQLWPVLTRIYLPEDTLGDRERLEGLPYREWARQGLVIPTPGSAIDYRYIRQDIQRLGRIFNIREIGFDGHQANETRTELEAEGFVMVEVRQGHRTLAGPTQTLESLYVSGRLRHGGNPVLRWMASNVVWRRNENNEYIPNKAKAARARKHIDGISALVTSLSRAVDPGSSGPAPYEGEDDRPIMV